MSLSGTSHHVLPPLASLITPALRPLPRWPLQALLHLAARHMAQRHPSVFARLQSLGPVAIAIDVTDLPYVFEFRPNAARHQLRLVERGAAGAAVAAIRGPLMPLLTLLQGRCDGDALFFSRVLTIEGDTAAVLALRNAIDNADVDLPADFAALFGPARGIVEWLARHVERQYFPLCERV